MSQNIENRRQTNNENERDDVASLLAKLYYDPAHPAGYSAKERLFLAGKSERPALKRASVKGWLSAQDTYTTHKPARKRYPRRKTIAKGIDYQWQADLVSVQNLKKFNKNYEYLLTVIDVFSRQAFAIALKNKSGPVVAKALDTLFTSEKRRPLYLQTDQGREFRNADVAKVLKKHEVELFSTHSETKAALIERWNRTLKSKMYRYFTRTRTLEFLDVLPELVEAYNSAKHRVLKLAPKDVNKNNEKEVWARLYGNEMTKKKPKFKFQLGDTVRASQVPGLFDKGYLPRWTREYYVVSHCINTKPATYKVRDVDGKLLSGSFYEHELQKIKAPPEDGVFDVRVLKKRRKNRKTEYFVHYIGWPKSHDRWIAASDIGAITK